MIAGNNNNIIRKTTVGGYLTGKKLQTTRLVNTYTRHALQFETLFFLLLNYRGK